MNRGLGFLGSCPRGAGSVNLREGEQPRPCAQEGEWVSVAELAIVAQFVANMDPDQYRARQSDAQPTDLDQGIELLSHQASQR